MERVTGKYDSSIDVAASSVLAAAFGWSLTQVAPHIGLAATGAASCAAFGLTHALMRLTGANRDAERSEPVAIEPLPFDERALAQAEAIEAEDAVRPLPPLPEADEPLVLDDILAEMEPESRVVRLFGHREEAPTAGELKDRIDQHLLRQQPPQPQDSEELSTGQQIAAALKRARAERG